MRYIRRAPRARWFQRKHVLARGLSWRLYTAAGILISMVTGWHCVQSVALHVLHVNASIQKGSHVL